MQNMWPFSVCGTSSPVISDTMSMASRRLKIGLTWIWAMGAGFTTAPCVDRFVVFTIPPPVIDCSGACPDALSISFQSLVSSLNSSVIATIYGLKCHIVSIMVMLPSWVHRKVSALVNTCKKLSLNSIIIRGFTEI